MIFTFSEEPSFGVDSTSQDYVLDIVSEDVITNIDYQKNVEFNHPTRRSRIPTVKNVGGRVGFELTYGNVAWNIFFKVLMGQRTILTDFSFAFSPERWNIITGMLTVDLSVSGTSFNITEYKTGEFNNIDGVIINGEYIAVATINNGAVTSSTRGSSGTTAALHAKNALVYGVSIDAGKTIDIFTRYKSGLSYFLPTSLNCLILREEDYFSFLGTQFSDFVFNARPPGGLKVSSMLRCKDSRIIDLSSPSQVTDDYPLVDTDHMNCYFKNEWMNILHFYFQVSNTLNPGPPKFFDSTLSRWIVNAFACYGQFSPVDSSSSFVKEYEDDEDENISLTICNSRQFDKAFVFSFNDLKWGTMIHTLRGDLLVDDSIPFYCYGENSLTVMMQY